MKRFPRPQNAIETFGVQRFGMQVPVNQGFSASVETVKRSFMKLMLCAPTCLCGRAGAEALVIVGNGVLTVLRFGYPADKVGRGAGVCGVAGSLLLNVLPCSWGVARGFWERKRNGVNARTRAVSSLPGLWLRSPIPISQRQPARHVFREPRFDISYSAYANTNFF